MTREVDSELPTFDNFGSALRYFRQTMGERAGRPYMRMSALGLTRCLTDHGYPITSASMTELEKGTSLPRDPDKFLTAVCGCLGIDYGSREWTILLQLLSRDYIAQKFGPGIARALVERDVDVLIERLLETASHTVKDANTSTDVFASREHPT